MSFNYFYYVFLLFFLLKTKKFSNYPEIKDSTQYWEEIEGLYTVLYLDFSVMIYTTDVTLDIEFKWFVETFTITRHTYVFLMILNIKMSLPYLFLSFLSVFEYSFSPWTSPQYSTYEVTLKSCPLIGLLYPKDTMFKKSTVGSPHLELCPIIL